VISTRFRRTPVIAGIIFLFLITGAALLYLDGFRQITPTEMARYFPTREATVLYLNVSAIRSSGLLDKLVGSTVGEDPEYRKFIEQTGFDYKRDLEQVMLNSAGGVHYFVLQGQFDWEKLRNYALAQNGTCRNDFCHMQGSTAECIISWRKLRRDLMALASARDEAGASAIDRRDPEQTPFAIPTAPVWLHAPAAAIRSTEALPPGTRLFAKAMQPAERAVFTLGPEKDQFQLGMDVICRNAEDAAALKAQLENITKLLNSLIARENKTPRPDDLSGVLTSGTFDRLDTHVRGRWAVRRAFLDSLGGG